MLTCKDYFRLFWFRALLQAQFLHRVINHLVIPSWSLGNNKSISDGKYHSNIMTVTLYNIVHT